MSAQLWAAFKKTSDRSALYIIRPNPNHGIRHKLIQTFCFIVYGNALTFIAANVIQRDGGIVMAAINSVFFLFTVVLLEVMYELYSKREKLNEIISWMTEPNWKKFHKSLQPQAGNRFTRIRHISARLIVLQIRFFDMLSSVGSLLLSAIMQCIPSMRYQLPLPWHLPVTDHKNWRAFAIGLTIQVTCFFFMAQVVAFFVAFILVFFLHINEYLNIILEGLEQLNRKLRDLDTRSNINFEESFLVLVKMIIDCVSTIAKFTKIYSACLMCVEIMSSFAIFTNAFILLIVKQKEHYFIAVAILLLNFIALAVAYIDDKVKEKVLKLSDALYDLPWDEMTPKQRTFIQFSMKCTNVDISFKCGNMHEFNLERFGAITKQTWSNTLVLKRMIEKNINAGLINGFE